MRVPRALRSALRPQPSRWLSVQESDSRREQIFYDLDISHGKVPGQNKAARDASSRQKAHILDRLVLGRRDLHEGDQSEH